MRLSCFARPDQDCTVELCTEDEKDFKILTSGDTATSDGQDRTEGPEPNEDLGIAVDIGTTTIAMELVALNSKKVLARDSRINHQRAFGADVISRIQANAMGKRKPCSGP